MCINPLMFRSQNNILVLVTLFLSCIFLPAFSEVVKKIEISGNDRISNETITMFSQVNIGDDLDDNDVNNLLKRLYDTNFFQDISIKLTSNKLSILVEENPIIENPTTPPECGWTHKNLPELVSDRRTEETSFQKKRGTLTDKNQCFRQILMKT